MHAVIPQIPVSETRQVAMAWAIELGNAWVHLFVQKQLSNGEVPMAIKEASPERHIIGCSPAGWGITASVWKVASIPFGAYSSIHLHLYMVPGIFMVSPVWWLCCTLE